jgi:hypothetical protein
LFGVKSLPLCAKTKKHHDFNQLKHTAEIHEKNNRNFHFFAALSIQTSQNFFMASAEVSYEPSQRQD